MRKHPNRILLLIVFWALNLSITTAQSDADKLRALFGEDCLTACFMGIHTGQSTLSEVEAMLQQEDIAYVKNIYETISTIEWELSPHEFLTHGQELPIILVSFSNQIALKIISPLNAPITAVIAVFGSPTYVTENRGRQTLTYPQYGITFVVESSVSTVETFAVYVDLPTNPNAEFVVLDGEPINQTCLSYGVPPCIIPTATPTPTLTPTDQPLLPGIYVTSLKWSKDGSLLAYGTGEIITPWGDWDSIGGSARVVDRNGTVLFSVNYPFFTVYNVEISPSENLVLVGSFSEVYELVTRQRILGSSDSIAFNDSTWHPTLDILLMTEVLGARIYDPLKRTTPSALIHSRLPANFPREAATVTSIWSPDATSAATSTTQGSIFIWDITQEVAATVQTTFSAHTASVQRLVWNAETNLIASGDDSGKIWVWNPATGQPVLELSGHVGAILALDWRSDGQQLISSGVDGTVRVWDWPSGAMQVVASGNIVSAIAYSPDGSELAYAGEVTDPDAISITTIPVEALVQPTPSLRADQ
jgi:WD40 repeat protein